VHEKGQRAFIGKCNMDRNSPPSYVELRAETSVADTVQLIEYIRSMNPPQRSSPNPPFPLVQPILTPRFAISCTDELLTSIGEIFVAEDTHSSGGQVYQHPPLPLQTHISENPSEVTATIGLFKHLPPPSNVPASHSRTEHSYASIYHHFHLLGPRTVLAHGVHLSEPELDLIGQQGTGLSHCAGSNFNLRSGVASVGRWLDKGIKVGLGTDVSGGFSPSILTEIRHASIASKVRGMMDSTLLTSAAAPLSDTPATAPASTDSAVAAVSQARSSFTSAQGLSVPTLLHLATLGGAEVCNLQDRVGSFAPGKEFDALLISLSSGANPAVWSESDVLKGSSARAHPDGLEQMLERFFFCGDDRNIRNVWVRGRLVGGTGLTSA